MVSDISAADACRRAFREVLLWLETETGGSRQDIAMLMGMVSATPICQVSNTFHTAPMHDAAPLRGDTVAIA